MTTIINKITAFLTLTVLLLSVCLTGCQLIPSASDPHKDAILLDYSTSDGKDNSPTSVGVFDADDMIHILMIDRHAGISAGAEQLRR